MFLLKKMKYFMSIEHIYFFKNLLNLKSFRLIIVCCNFSSELTSFFTLKNVKKFNQHLSSVACLYFRWRNDEVLFLCLVLKSFSVSPTYGFTSVIVMAHEGGLVDDWWLQAFSVERPYVLLSAVYVLLSFVLLAETTCNHQPSTMYHR